MARMTDRSGRTGPATWEAGDYATGQENHPAAGVSWYEAAAFAKFAGKSVPTVFHWNHAASEYLSASIVPTSNFSGRGTVPVGSTRGISAYRSEEHTSELQSRGHLVCRLLLEKKKTKKHTVTH